MRPCSGLCKGLMESEFQVFMISKAASYWGEMDGYWYFSSPMEALEHAMHCCILYQST